jgi:hypothetical protein
MPPGQYRAMLRGEGLGTIDGARQRGLGIAPDSTHSRERAA